MGFKIPIGYRQLEDRNTEVVYDDGSTLSLFGGNDGVEGDEGMFIKITGNGDTLTMDKTFLQIEQAVQNGKMCYGIESTDDGTYTIYYVTTVAAPNVLVITSFNEDTAESLRFIEDENTGFPVYYSAPA